MAAIAPIVINDGKATPVAHTLNPVSTIPNPLWRDSVATLSQNGQVYCSVTRVAQGKDLDKVRIVLGAPAMEAASGANAQGYTAAPKVAYEVKADLTIFLPSRSLQAQNKDLRVMLVNLLQNSQIVDVIDNGVQPY